MAEQRYKAVLAVIGDGRTITEVASAWSVSRQTLHQWLTRYEEGGLEALSDRSHRPDSCPHQMSADIEVAVLELRRIHPGWGPRRIVFELAKQDTTASESGVYRALRRANLIAPPPGDGDGRTGNGGNAPDRWSCGRWTSWAGSGCGTGARSSA